MKPFIIILLSILTLSACESPAKQTADTNSVESFAWLVGNWKRTNDEVPQQTYENWLKSNENLYVGHGFTLIEADTVWQEFIKLEKGNNTWSFKVIKQNDSVAIIFEASEIGDKWFTCFNLKNEFPSHIKYVREDDKLNALIWKDSMSIPFNFVKVN